MPVRELPAWARPSDIVDLVKLAGPIAISRMSMMLMSLTDAIVLGQVAPTELPYILNSWLPMGVALGFGIGILLGTQVLTAEMSGRGEREHTGRIFRRGFKFAMIVGALITVVIVVGAGPMFNALFAPEIAAPTASATRILAYGLLGHMVSTVLAMYLEALRRPFLVSAVMYGGVAFNLLMNLIFVVGIWGMPQMGADGVALATTITRYLIVAILLVVVLKLTPALKPSPPAPEGEWKRQLSVGAGTAVSNVAEWGGFNFTYVIATWISLSTNVVYGYATQVMGVCFMVFLGLGTATSVRVAEAVGRGNALQVREASRLGVVATILCGVLLGVLVYILRDPIAEGLVRADAVMEGVALAAALSAVFYLVALAIVFDGLQAVCSMAMRAQGVVWLPSIIHLASFFALMLPLGYWHGLVMGNGARGMVEAALVAVFVAGVAQLLLLELKTAPGSKS